MSRYEVRVDWQELKQRDIDGQWKALAKEMVIEVLDRSQWCTY